MCTVFGFTPSAKRKTGTISLHHISGVLGCVVENCSCSAYCTVEQLMFPCDLTTSGRKRCRSLARARGSCSEPSLSTYWADGIIIELMSGLLISICGRDLYGSRSCCEYSYNHAQSTAVPYYFLLAVAARYFHKHTYIQQYKVPNASYCCTSKPGQAQNYYLPYAGKM